MSASLSRPLRSIANFPGQILLLATNSPILKDVSRKLADFFQNYAEERFTGAWVSSTITLMQQNPIRIGVSPSVFLVGLCEFSMTFLGHPRGSVRMWSFCTTNCTFQCI